MDCELSPPLLIPSFLPHPLPPLGTLSTAAYEGPTPSSLDSSYYKLLEGNAKKEPSLRPLLSFFSPLKLKEQKARQSNVHSSHPQKYCPGHEAKDY